MCGPQYQVEVVGHEAIAEQVDRQAGACVDDRLDEGVVIAGLVENGLVAVASIEGVISHATDRMSIKAYVPGFLSSSDMRNSNTRKNLLLYDDFLSSASVCDRRPRCSPSSTSRPM